MSKGIIVPAIFTAVDKFTAPIRKMQAAVTSLANKSEAELARMERSWRRIDYSAMKIGRNMAMVTAAIAIPLIYATKQAVEFEDKMADVGKTTGMEGASLEKFGDALLEMSTNTRTSLDDLIKIGEIGGQLGIAEDQLLSFTDSANKFNVALGSDFSGGVEEAISAVGNIKALFDQTRGLDISDSIQKVGSAINELGAKGSGTSANISDFTLRMGALPDALKPSVQSTMALGAFFEEMGINAQIAAGGTSNLLLVAGRNVNDFAKQMNITSDAAKKLLAESPTQFMKDFAKSFEGMAPDVLAKKLNDLGIGSQETIKVIGALSSGTERLEYLQRVANESFADGISLQNEYNKKNSTAAAQWGILKNNFHAATITLGKAFLPILVDLMKSITPMVKSFGNWARQNKGLLTTLTKIAAVIAAVSGAVSVLSFGVGGFAKIMVGAIKLMTFFKTNALAAAVATKVMNAAMLLTPWGIAIGAALALGVAIYSLTKAFKSQSAAERVGAELKQRVLDNTIDQRVEVMLLFKELRALEAGSAAYNDTLAKLEEIQPGIIEKHNLQAGAIQDINAAERELIQTIMERAKTEAAAELMREKFKRQLELEQQGAADIGWMDYLTLGVGGGDIVAEGSRQKEMQSLQEEIDVLANIVVGDKVDSVNPEAEKQNVANQRNTANKETIIIDFKNVPAGLGITRQQGSSMMSMPGVSSTR